MAIPNYFFYQNIKADINRTVKLTEEQEFWRKHTYQRFAYMKWSRQQNHREDDWRKWERQYEAWRPPKNMEWQSNIVPPFTTSVVESALSELVDQNLMPTVGARKKEDVPKALTVDFIKRYTWDIGYGDVELYKGLKQMLIYGQTWWQDYYLQEFEKNMYLVSYNPKTGREEWEEKTIASFDDCYGETVDIWDLWFDPDARSVNMGPYKAQDAIRRYVMHIDVFKRMFVGSRWDKFGLAKYVQPSGDTNYYQFYQPPQGIDRGSQVEVLFHWIRQPDKLIIMANDIPFCIMPKPYNHKLLPFSGGSDLMSIRDIYGKGEPQLLESIQDELTTVRRMRLDRTKLDIYKMFFVSNREAITDRDLIPGPMKPIYVEDVGNVQPFEYRDINPSAYKEEQLLKEDGHRVTGVDDQAQSVAGSAETATKAAILKEATLKRLRTKIWLTSRTLLTGVIQLRVPNIIQFYQSPKIQEIMGRDAVDKWMKIKKAGDEGRLLQMGNKFFEQEYRTIVTRNKELKKMPDGQVTVLDKRGDHFFMVTPDVLIPSSPFIYKLSAEPTVPLSRPLLQQKVGELMQHPIMMAAFQSGYYSYEKGADKLVEINDFDPDDFIATKEENPQATDDREIDPQRMMEFASRENELMMAGAKLPGTPYASSEHTLMHLNFMKSGEFQGKASNVDVISAFSKHILEENAAQKMRTEAMQLHGGGGNMLGSGQATPADGMGMRGKENMGIMAGEAKATMPNKVVGPEMTPDLAGFMGFGPGR